MDLEKTHGRVKIEDLWQSLRMNAVVDKLLNRIKNMYVNSLTCIKVKQSESECFRTASAVRQDCMMLPWLFNVHMNAVMNKVKMRMGVIFLEGGEGGDYLTSCMQTTWFCGASRMKPWR